jgi:hypothetical protein
MEDNAVTLQELEDNLPNGFRDAEIFSFELNYVEGNREIPHEPIDWMAG